MSILILSPVNGAPIPRNQPFGVSGNNGPFTSIVAKRGGVVFPVTVITNNATSWSVTVGAITTPGPVEIIVSGAGKEAVVSVVITPA